MWFIVRSRLRLCSVYPIYFYSFSLRKDRLSVVSFSSVGCSSHIRNINMLLVTFATPMHLLRFRALILCNLFMLACVRLPRYALNIGLTLGRYVFIQIFISIISHYFIRSMVSLLWLRHFLIMREYLFQISPNLSLFYLTSRDSSSGTVRMWWW